MVEDWSTRRNLRNDISSLSKDVKDRATHKQGTVNKSNNMRSMPTRADFEASSLPLRPSRCFKMDVIS